MILTLLGGIGIFLVGMILLSDGLKAAAGGALRSILERFARTPARATLSGAAVTALVQSSSATTLTTIGFVSAGLLTFPQAVGLIFGANLGTTSTGWLVSVIGLRVSVGALALPLVGIGALLRLLGRGRWAHGGMAIAGFGLIFVGIDVLQTGMADVADRLDPGRIPSTGFVGILLLVLAGTALTVVMQSSSAAVATTLTALHAGGIGLEQAALLVVGQNLGTSIKAILAAIGGGVPVRRTAAAHTLFNLITAGLALALLPLLLRGSVGLSGAQDPALAIAIFHSSFNLLGVLVLFPVLGRFAALVERLVPEVRPSLTRNLDPSVARLPDIAVESARRSTMGVADVLLGALARRAEVEGEGAPGAAGGGAAPSADAASDLREVTPALAAIRAFLSRVATDPDEPGQFERHLSVLHALDHLDRLDEVRRRPVSADVGDPAPVPFLTEAAAPRMASVLGEALPLGEGSGEVLGTFSRAMAEHRRTRREALLADVAAGRIDVEEGRRRILALKEADRLAYHAWRAAHHLERAGGTGVFGEGGEGSGGSAQGPAATGDAEADEFATGEVAEADPKPRV